MLVNHLYTRIGWLLAVVISLAMLSSYAHAHEGLHEQIVAITAKIKRDPKNASLYLHRGELHRLHRDWTRAAADYDRAERLEPELTIVGFVRGRMLFESGRLQRAKFTLDRFLAHQPNHFEALVTRARVLAKLGAADDALNDFTHALTISPDPELYLERAQVEARDGRHIAQALTGLDEGIRNLGPLATLQIAAIDLELRRRNYDAALTRLETVMSQSERKEAWLARRGEILELAARPQEARAAFQDALAAIASLPPNRRQTRSITALQLRIRTALASQ
jgi:tetratricopeptide (TPR) repeat protein